MLVANACVIEIKSDPRKIFWGRVVILNLVIQDKQRRKISGKFGQKTILGISFDIFSMESHMKLNGILMRISNTSLSL